MPLLSKEASEHNQALLRKLAVDIKQYCAEHTGENAQDAYVKNAAIHDLANHILENMSYLVEHFLNSHAKLHARGAEFSREELEDVAITGGFCAKTGTTSRSFGGLLDAILHVEDNTDIARFASFAQAKIHGAVYDYIRRQYRIQETGQKGSDRAISLELLRNRANGEVVDPTRDYDWGRDTGILKHIDTLLLLKAAKTLSAEDQAVVVPFVEAIGDHAFDAAEQMHEGSHLWFRTGITPQLKKLKMAYLRLSDDELPDVITNMKYLFREASDEAKLMQKMRQMMHFMDINAKDLAEHEGLGQSRMSQRFASGEITWKMLDALGITSEHLHPKFHAIYPECWTEKHVKQQKQKLSETENWADFAKTLKPLLGWAIVHRQEVANKHYGTHFFKVSSLLERLENPNFHMSTHIISSINTLLQVIGVADESLPSFVRGFLDPVGGTPMSSHVSRTVPVQSPVRLR